jgi:hypothetical protein
MREGPAFARALLRILHREGYEAGHIEIVESTVD